MLQFGQKSVESKDFYKNKKITETPPKVFTYGVQQYSKNSAWKMGLNLKDHDEWANNYRKIWKAVEELQMYVEEARIKPIEKCRLLNHSKDNYKWL